MAVAVFRGQYLRGATRFGLPEIAPGAPGASGSHLIREGIYGRIRHPAYLEGALLMASIALFCNYLFTWLLLAAYLPAIGLVVALEERELTERFGDAYRHYAKQVPRFIPHLSRKR